MIQFLESNILDKNEHTLMISYQRTVPIIFGNYPYIDDIHNLIIEIKNNISKKNSYVTNVKGGMTSFNHFINHRITNKFINYCIHKHQASNPQLFEKFYERKSILNVWGNEIKENEYVQPHTHECTHCIIYLTKGAPLILPEINIQITPDVGDYYFFPPSLIHYVPKHEETNIRYNMVINIADIPNWERISEIQKVINKK